MITTVAVSPDEAGTESFAEELKPGTRLLLGQFTIDSFLSAGGFGITYLARDSLDRRVVVKECFPSSVCRRSGSTVSARSRQRQDEFKSIVGLFLAEATNLAQMAHPNIVKVHQVFQDNETAYMAMDWIDGPDLLATMEGAAPRLTPAQIVHALTRLLDALEHVHGLGFLHRDISPDNILLDRTTGEPVLIDFGAARKDVTRKSRVLSGLRVVKDGYSPQEFYITGSKQSPCSDLYALAASFCHLVSGETPKTSQERLSAIANGAGDPQRPLLGRVQGYDPAFLAAIDRAMSIFPRDRLQSAAEWKDMLTGGRGQPVATAPPDQGPEVASPQPDPAADRAPLFRVPPAPALAQPSFSLAAADDRNLVAGRRANALQQLGKQGIALGGLALSRLSVVGISGRVANLAKRPGRLAAGRSAGAAAAAVPGLRRVVQVPFVADRVTPGLVSAALPWSPDWVHPGGRIVMVNGGAVTEGVGLQAMLAGRANLARCPEVNVELGYLPADGGAVITLTETLPVVTELRVGDGLLFEMQPSPTGVRTVVLRSADAGDGTLLPGDSLLAYLPTGEILGTATALAEIVKREGANRIATFSFAVQRQGKATEGFFKVEDPMILGRKQP